MEPSFHWFSLVCKTQNCSTNVNWSLYKQLFCTKRKNKYWGASANACFISKLCWRRFSEVRVKPLQKKNNDCCNIFVAVCTLSTKSNAHLSRSCCFCGLCQEVTSSVILAKFSKVTNCKLLWFPFLASCPLECCILSGTMPERGDRFLQAGDWCMSFPSGDNQLC